ncbi:MAG: InlB B-repeat-containing protein [Lachnospiraceae bacterium]
MEKGKRTGRRLLSWLLVVVMMLSLVPVSGIQAEAATSDDSAENSVSLVVDQSPKLEVALAVGNTKQNYAAFEEDLKAALEKKGILSDNISFVEVDANASTSQDSFSWWTYDHSTSESIIDQNHQYIEAVSSSETSSQNAYNGKKNHIETTNNGATMNFYGYGMGGYTDFNFLPNEQATKKTIEFTIEEKQAYDALDGVGFLVNTSITGASYINQKINGYLVFLQYNGSTGQSIKLFKLENVSAKTLHTTSKSVGYLNNISGVSLVATALTTYGNTKFRKIKIEIMPDYLKMWYNGSSADNSSITLGSADLVNWGNGVTEYSLVPGYDTVSDKEVYRGGYGPLASYGSHSCDQPTLATLSNLKMTADYVRSLTEVVREPNWSEDKQSFLVNLNEAAIEDFSKDYTTAEIINRLEQDKVTYIGWCSDANKEGSLAFVDGISDGSGLVNMNDTKFIASGKEYYDRESYLLQIDEIARIIAEKVAKQTTEGGIYTYLDTDDFRFTSTGAALNDGNWSVGYSDTSFEKAKESVSNYSDLATAPFTRAGYYEIYYGGDTDTAKARIRIHQAPKALFSASVDSDTGAITVKNTSYDPDVWTSGEPVTDTSEAGITSSTIEYRNVTDSGAWTEVKPESIDVGEVWMVRLTVTDADGATDILVQQITRQSTGGGETQTEEKAPYNTFTLSKSQYITGIDEYVEVYDQSYTLDGQTDFTVKYILKNSSGTEVLSTTSSQFAPQTLNKYLLSGLSAGSYTITMTASTASGKESEAVSRTFTVKNGYKVTYDAGEGSGAPSTQYKLQGENLTLSSVAPARSGYIFAGWDANDDGNVDYQPGDVYTANEGLVLKAVWKLPFVYRAEGYSGVYDGEGHNIAVTVTTPATMEGVTISYAKADTVNSDVSEENINETSFSLTDAGTYKVFYKIEKEGYLTVSGSKTVTIEKADPKEVKLTNTVHMTETGSARAVDPATVTGVKDETVEGSITYTYYVDKDTKTLTNSENSGATTNGGAPSKKGTYYVKAHFEGNQNYNPADSNRATVTIVPDVYYLNSDGEKEYGTLQDAISAEDNLKKQIYIEGDMAIDQDVTLPAGYTLTIKPGITVELLENVTLTNEGTIRNNGTITGDGKIVNKNTFSGGEVAAPFDNEGKVSNTDFTDPDNTVNNNGDIDNCNGDSIVNGENGKVTNGGEVVSYLVTYDAVNSLDNSEGVTNPESQSVNWGDKITDAPVVEDIPEVAEFQGWYKEAACTNEWDFDNDTVNSDITLYAKWKEYSSFEAYWVDQDGNKHYGTFDEVLEQVKNPEEGTTCKELHIQKPVDITTDVEVPEGVPVIIDESGELKLAPDTTFTVPSGITNNGKILAGSGAGEKPVVEGDVENNSNKDDCGISGIKIEGDVKNNEDATISDSDISGDLDNDGTVADSTVSGDVTNNETGTLKNTTPDENSKFINNGNYTDNNGNPIEYTITYQITPGESAAAIADKTVQYGALAPFARPEISGDSGLVFSGWYTDAQYTELWNFKEDIVLNNVTLYTKLQEASEFDVYWLDPNDGNPTYGTLKQALESGSSEVTIQKDITIPDGTTIPKDMEVTIAEGVTVTIPSDATVTVDGELINNGTVTNKGIIDGDGTLTNNKTINGGTIDAAVDNNGKINEAYLSGDVTNNGTIIDSTLAGDVVNKGTISNPTLTEDSNITNEEGGKVLDNGYNSISCQVTFNINNHGSVTPESQTITCGKTVAEPDEIKDSDYVLTGWYTDAACEESQKWDFAKSTVSRDITLYAGWREKSDYEAYWINAEGEKEYGSFEEALQSGSNEVHIQKDTSVESDLTIPEGMQVTVDPDKTLTLAENGSLKVDGALSNEGIIEGAGKNSSSPQITGNVTNEEGAAIENCNIQGDVENAGNITDTKIEGDVTKNTGTITGGDITGAVTNESDGEITDSKIQGDVTNSGTISETDIQADNVTNDGSITGGTITGAEGSDSKANVTNGENGKMSGVDVTGDVTNDGEVSDGSTINGDTINNGQITDSTLNGSVDNDGEIADSTITAGDGETVKNSENGTISGSTIDGSVDNDGALQSNNLENAIVDNTDGSITDVDNKPVTVTVSFDVQDKSVAPADQTIELGKKAEQPANPQDEEYTVTGWYNESSCITKWDFAKDTVKKDITLYAKWESKDSFEAYWTEGDGVRYGTLEEALKSGSSDVTIRKDVTLPDGAVIPEDMTVTVPEGVTVTIPKDAEVTVDGTLDNNGIIYNNGAITGEGTLNNDKTIYGGTIDTAVNNTGKIDGAVLNGTVENNGRITDSTLSGEVTNNGTITDSTLSGEITNNGTISGGELTDSSNVTNNKTITGCDINGKVVNTDSGKIVDDSLDGISYKVTFDTNGHGSPVPESQTIACGRTVQEPDVIKDADYVFLAWYKDKECTEGQEWNFATDTVSAATTLYAAWREKSDYEAYWINTDGEKEYGTFEEALESGSNEVHIQKDTTVDNELTIPEGMQITVDSGKTLTLAENGSLKVDGALTNKGIIEGTGKDSSNPQITGKVTNEEGAAIENCSIQGDVDNAGTIEDTVIDGNVDNAGTITDAEIEGDVKNTGNITKTDIEGKTENEGTIAESNLTGDVENGTTGTIENSDVTGNVSNAGQLTGGSVAGDVDNSGSISDTEIKADKVDNSGEITGADIKPLDEEKGLEVTNDSNGKISNTDIAGDVTNNGEITEGSTVSGTTTNDGVISDSTLEGNVVNKGTLENNNLEGAEVDNTEGVVKNDEQVVTYTVSFVPGEYGTAPDAQTIDYGKEAVWPKDPVDDQYAFAGWYEEALLVTEFDFASPIKKDTVLYGKWVLKSATEAYWIVNDETKYGTFEQALESGSKDIHITKDIEFTQDVTIPEGVTVTVESGVTVSVDKNTSITLSKDTELVNNGKLDNDGTIAGEGILTNNKNITGGTVDTEIVNNGTVNNSELNGYVTNNKAINDSEINAGLNNSNGTVSVDGDQVVFKDQQVKGVISKGTSETSEILANAEVKLVQGNEVIQTVVTDAEGKYDLSEIPSGVYNLVITSADGVVNTLLAEVGEDDIQISDIELPEGNLNNTVEVKEGTPNVVVGGLNSILTAESVQNDNEGITAADKEVLDNGGNVEVRFIAEQKAEIPSEALDIEKVIAEDQKQVGMNLDLSVLKTVTDANGDITNETNLTDLQSTIMVNIPIAKELQGKKNYVVYRFHDGSVDRITENSGEEYISINSDTTAVTLYAKKFSTYILAYDKEETSGTENPDSGNSGEEKTDTKPAADAGDKKDDLTANLTAEQKKNVDLFVSKLGLSEKEAIELLQFAEENDISMDTLLVTENTILTQNNDNDITGSYFAKMQAGADKLKTTSIKVKWNKISGADGYLIYGNKCGKGNKYQLIKTIKGGNTTSFTQKKLAKGTYYKYVVRAYKQVGNQKITIALSKTIHAVTLGGKYGVAKSVKTNKSSISLKKGKSFTIKAEEVKGDKTIKRHRNIAFESSDATIASVSKKGVVKGVKKGTCYIYVYAQNGVYKKIKVTVK